MSREHARAYIKVIKEATNAEGVDLAVQQTSCSTIHGQERRAIFQIDLSVRGLGEVAGRALGRRSRWMS